MGRCRSHELMEYKENIMKAICTNPRLVSLLTPDELRNKSKIINPSDLPYNIVYPYDFIPETQTKKGRYLSFELTVYPSRYNEDYKTIQIDFSLLCEKALIKFPDPDKAGYVRCWNDLVICELDDMFMGNNPIDIGIGDFKFVATIPKIINYAREIPYSMKVFSIAVYDWMDGKTYGK